MLLIFATHTKQDCLQKLGSVLCQHPDLDLTVVQSIAEVSHAISMGGVGAVFCLGSVPLEECQAAGFAPKNRKITGLRKSVLSFQGIPMLVSYSPSIGDVEYGQFVDLLTDTNLACRLAKTGTTAPQYGEYHYTTNLTPVVEGVRALIDAQPTGLVPLAFDTETLGLDRFHPEGYLISLQFSYRKGTAWMIAWKSRAESHAWLQDFQNQQDLHWLLNEQRISLRAANGKYDLEWVYEHSGVTCTNFRSDTTLIGSLLDENRSNGLDVHAKIYAPRLAGYSDDFDQKTDKSRMDLAYAKDPQKFLNYSAGDADATLEVAEEQIKQLVALPPVAKFYVTILHPAARAFEAVERGGVCIDMGEFNRLEADLIADLHKLTNEAKSILGGSLVAKHFDIDKVGGLNLTKASLIIDFMFSPRGLNLKPKMLTDKTKAPVSSMEHLEMFKEVPEAKAFVSLMSEFSSTNKTLSTYINGFRQHIRSDGKFHPSYFLFAGNKDEGDGGTNTGRISVKDPAFQCLKGSTSVYNKEGWTSLLSIVEGYEQGKPFTVLTHTGEWKPVVGVYRNGIKPLLKITTKSGAVLECTGNHPWLTDYGFVQAGKLIVGSKVWRFYETAGSGEGVSDRPVDSDRGLGDSSIRPPSLYVPVRVRDGEGDTGSKSDWCEAEQVLWLLQAGQADNTWSQSQRGSILDLLVLAAHEGQVLQTGQQGLQDLWCKGHTGLRFVERFVRDLSSRYGGETTESHVREIGRKWELLQGQLHMGNGLSTGPEQDKLTVPDIGWDYQAPMCMGRAVERTTEFNLHEIASWVERDSSPYHAFQAHQAGFGQDTIVSIEVVPAEETYDLTIEDSHSFVANGIVVHNTIPKHTKWGKRIRCCYNAPPGMLVVEEDYSQGELKVMACLANEAVMIEAYQKNLDLHVVTSSFVAGLTYEEMMALKKSDKDKYDDIRQLGKAGNFGLIYGMGVDGFIEYARISYGVIMDYDKAAEFHAGFFTRYPGLPKYHKAYKAYAHQHGHVMSPLGRRRNLPMINAKRSDIRSKDERRAVNAPVQATLSDMMLWAIALQNDMGWYEESPCFGAIHDAAYFYIPEDNAEFYARRSTEVMENLPFHKIGWEPQLKFTADAKIGKNMGDLKEIKFT